MPESKALSMLGLARRAGKLSMGHDMAVQSVVKRRAKCVIITSDASQRLEGEFDVLIKKHSICVPIIRIKPTMEEIHFNLGYRAGIMTVDDENFYTRINTLLQQEDMIYGS